MSRALGHLCAHILCPEPWPVNFCKLSFLILLPAPRTLTIVILFFLAIKDFSDFNSLLPSVPHLQARCQA